MIYLTTEDMEGHGELSRFCLDPFLVHPKRFVYAWTGECDHTLEQLENVAMIPNGVTYGDLGLNPCWDDLRSDPRFNKIVAAAKAASR
jgi:hypothetical protein